LIGFNPVASAIAAQQPGRSSGRSRRQEKGKAMINAKLFRDEGILTVEPVSKLTTTDFEQISNLVNPFIEDHGHLNGVLIDAESFPGWEDLAGALSHLRFIDEYEKKVERVAAVTDNQLLAILPRVANYFVSAEVRQFPYAERDRALDWLRAGKQPQREPVD
jgi:hypothetical protein